MTNWYDDDSFWETFRNYMFSAARVELARTEVDSLLAFLELSPGAHVPRPLLWSRTPCY